MCVLSLIYISIILWQTDFLLFMCHEFYYCIYYRNDPRYVNAWLDTAQASEKSDAIFAYMRSNDIGTKCASFYVAWADKYEKDGEYNSARALYDLGIKHHAEPYETISIIKT